MRHYLESKGDPNPNPNPSPSPSPNPNPKPNPKPYPGAKRCKGMLLTGADKESDLCVHISPISPYISPVSPPDKESDLCDAAALTQPQPQP